MRENRYKVTILIIGLLLPLACVVTEPFTPPTASHSPLEKGPSQPVASRGTTEHTAKVTAVGSQGEATPAATPTPSPSPTATPIPPKGKGKIAFAYQGSLWIMNSDGSGRTRITDDLGAWSRPSWSPDAKQIAFTANSNIYAANADGSGIVRLEGRPDCQASDPSWSPDGRRIAFVCNNLPGGVVIMNADGTNSVDLVESASFPAWSPDGTRIAIEGRPPGTEDTGLYILDTSGKVLSRVTDIGMYPDWSPDGSKIVHVITKPGSGPVIGIVDLVAGSELQLPVKGLGPSWSPDGRRIAFTTGSVVFTMNPDGSDVRELGPGDAPAWGP